MKEKFTFFWNGPFSQWASAKFTVGGVEYNCTEQYMMAMKAMFFDDDEALKSIMSTSSPYKQKHYGRLVENFDADKWSKVCEDFVYVGNYAKFTQNQEYYEDLMKTIGTTLVEASPVDKIWGIGLNAQDKRAQSRDTWRGLNLLGETITKVRDSLIKERV